MAKKSKLLSALDAHKGRDFEKERQKKLQKAAEKRKRSKAEQQEEDSDAEEGEVWPCLRQCGATMCLTMFI